MEFVEKYRQRKDEEMIKISESFGWVPGKKRVLNAIMQVQYFDWILNTLDISYCVLEESETRKLYETLQAMIRPLFIHATGNNEENVSQQVPTEIELKRGGDQDDSLLTLDESQSTSQATFMESYDSELGINEEEPRNRRRMDYYEVAAQLSSMYTAENIVREV